MAENACFDKGSKTLTIHESLMEMMPLCLSARGGSRSIEKELKLNPSYHRYLKRQVGLMKLVFKRVNSLECLEIQVKKGAVEGFWLGDYGRFLRDGTFDPCIVNKN